MRRPLALRLAGLSTRLCFVLGLLGLVLAAALQQAIQRPVPPGTNPPSALAALEIRWRPPSPLQNDGRSRALLDALFQDNPLAARAIGSVGARIDLRHGEHAVSQALAALVSGPYFQLLGVRPQVGELFQAPDFGTTRAARREIVLSHALWQRLGAPPIGSTLISDGFARGTDRAALNLRLIGVTAPGFVGARLGVEEQAWLAWPDWPDILLPADQEASHALSRAQSFVAIAVGDDTLTALQDRLNADAARRGLWHARQGLVQLAHGASLDPRARQRLSAMVAALQLGSSLLAVLVVCAYLLDRWLHWSRRRPELALRRCLGESPAFTLRRVLVEGGRELTLWVAITAAAAALLLARSDLWLGSLLQDAGLTPALLLHSLLKQGGIVLLLLLVLLLLPLLGAPSLWRRDLPRNRLPGSERRLRALVIVAALLLIAQIMAAALAGHWQISHWARVGLGFDLGEAQILEYRTESNRAGLERRLSQQSADTEIAALLAALSPGINPDQVVLASSSPLSVGRIINLERGNAPDALSRGLHPVVLNAVSDNYFRRLGIRLLHGHGFQTQADRDDGVIVNRSQARQLFGREQVVGERITLADASFPGVSKSFRILGVVDDAHYLDPRHGPIPVVYLPLQRVSDLMAVMVFGAGQAELGQRLTAALQTVAPDWQIRPQGGLRSELERALSEQRLRRQALYAVLLLALPLAALVLLNAGSHLLLEYRRDIAVMRALGAGRLRIVRDLARRHLGRSLLLAPVLAAALIPPLLGRLWPDLPWPQLLGITTIAAAIVMGFALLLLALLATSLDDHELTLALKADA
ncbi:ABC transporter permease [Rehaibacterium terrae]|jgi:hypothetical protein|uniref:MacB-like periplasmic core domain-containing protein n=1 Tax=Rehaibacterium terrae TaxID=1341696 RepID=A0A7W8DDC2_9GAMM|nr:ABC transporter permease [Rehaibacterium terrae]MBB5015032.1 hypothetical protein [Rehaibacterium terrae]